MTFMFHTKVQILKQNGLQALAVIRSRKYSGKHKAYNLATLKRGPGGRSSFNGIVATVFGATGFVGRYVCNRLGKIGTQMIIPYRGDPYEAMSLKLCGDLGQVLYSPFNLKDEDSINRAMYYSNVVINLIGRDWQTRNFKFEDVHVTGARLIAKCAKQNGVERLIHISTLNGSDNPPSHVISGGSKFLKTKYQSECAVLEEFPEATIFRPADVYGQEDRFIRLYAHPWRRQLTWMPLYKNGLKTIKQPVHVSDLAAGIVAAIRDPDTAGRIYQAVGPNRYLLAELVDWFYKLMNKHEDWGYKRYDMAKDLLFKLKVSLTYVCSPCHPVANLHWDRLERECITDEVDPTLCTLEDLGINLTRMEDQVPWELRPFTFGIYHNFGAQEPFPNPPGPKVEHGL